MAEDKKPPPQLLGTGAARQAATAIKSRAQQLEEAEKKDTGYAAGGMAKAPSTAAIKAYSKEYDTIRPAGKNVHEAGPGRRYAAGGLVATQSRGFGKARKG
jgi:hypothetical protein